VAKSSKFIFESFTINRSQVNEHWIVSRLEWRR